MSTKSTERNSTPNKEYKYGYVGESITNNVNMDVYDTLTPLWLRKDDLSPIEQSLVYSIAVLSKKLMRLEMKVYTLQNEKTDVDEKQ
jgi:hypothetical protein